MIAVHFMRCLEHYLHHGRGVVVGASERASWVLRSLQNWSDWHHCSLGVSGANRTSTGLLPSLLHCTCTMNLHRLAIRVGVFQGDWQKKFAKKTYFAVLEQKYPHATFYTDASRSPSAGLCAEYNLDFNAPKQGIETWVFLQPKQPQRGSEFLLLFFKCSLLFTWGKLGTLPKLSHLKH